ncbi:MAG: beta-galactosidase [bacterium]
MNKAIRSLILVLCFILSFLPAPGAAEIPPYRAAIFDEPDFPAVGQATPAQTFHEAFAAEGIESVTLTADQLSDPAMLQTGRLDLLVIPTGASFPLSAKDSLLSFLQNGGDLFCTGGYAFDHLLVRQNGQWIDYHTVREAAEARARDPHFSLISQGGFEDGHSEWVTSQPEQCTITEQPAFAGTHAAQVVNHAALGARWERTLSVTPGETYLIGAQARTKDIQGTGYGYLAVYQYGANNQLLRFADFAQFKQDQDWKRHESQVEIDASAKKVVFYGGLYLATGTLWFDEVTCASLPRDERINAHYGVPEDGLRILPTQLTLFSPDQPLRGNRVILSPSAAYEEEWKSEGAVEGWEATAQLQQNARWLPLLDAQDENGRFAGTAGAMVNHHTGPFHHSRWVLFGISNRDLFQGQEGQILLRMIIRRLQSGVFIQTLTPEQPIYAKGESAHLILNVNNSSLREQILQIELSFASPDTNGNAVLHTATQTSITAGQTTQRLTFTWDIPDHAPDFVAVQAIVKSGDTVLDTLRSGFCVYDENTLAQGTKIRYLDNAFELTPPDGTARRVSLWGTDTYGNYFQSPNHSPWTWYQEIQSMRDHGLHLFENLQFIPYNHTYNERQWRQLDAFIQLCQRFALPYMAGLLIGQDVVVSDDELARQAELCRRFAARYKNAPGLIYYLNGDFQLRMKDTPDIRRLWNEFLQKRYGSEETLKQAWRIPALDAEWGSLPAREHYAQSWYDVQARDRQEFQIQLMRRWIQALCQAIRAEDPDHPITSEYYQRPFSGIDLRLTLGEMDAANFGYFDQPRWDLARLMAVVKWNDMRWYGKTINMGEFGVKTHDAWKTQYGAAHYHIQRTPAEQLDLFWWIPHTAWAMGVTKIQNWCWSDDPDRVFPWGIAWNNPLRPKPAAKLYRNLRLLSEMIHPEYIPSDTIFVMPDTWRLGAPESLSYTSLLNALDCLLATNIPYAVVNESSLPGWTGKLPRLIIAPLAYALPDDVVQALEQMARNGACVYVSGDPSTTPLGTRAAQRLERLCGVKSTGTAQHRSGLPLPLAETVSARETSTPTRLTVYENNLGKGRVLYVPEPWETFPGQELFVTQPELTSNPETNFYATLISLAGIPAPAEIRAGTGVWRFTEMKSHEDTWITVLPRSAFPPETRVEVVRSRETLQWSFLDRIPAGVLLNPKGQALAVTGSRSFAMQNQAIIQGESPWMMVGLDHRGLSESQRLILCTTRGGKLWWHNQAGELIASAVEWQAGMLETIYPQAVTRVNDGWAIETQPAELYLAATPAQWNEAVSTLQDLFTGNYPPGASAIPESSGPRERGM